MFKKPRFTTPFDSQNAKGSQTLVKCAPQYIYHVSLSLWGKLSWYIFLLVISVILGHFVNTLTADDKYFLRNRKNLPQSIQMQLSKKQKTFWTFCSISDICVKFRKMFKKPVSKHRSIANLLNGPKRCWNLHDSILTKFFHHSAGNRFGICFE